MSSSTGSSDESTGATSMTGSTTSTSLLHTCKECGWQIVRFGMEKTDADGKWTCDKCLAPTPEERLRIDRRRAIMWSLSDEHPRPRRFHTGFERVKQQERDEAEEKARFDAGFAAGREEGYRPSGPAPRDEDEDGDDEARPDHHWMLGYCKGLIEGSHRREDEKAAREGRGPAGSTFEQGVREGFHNGMVAGYSLQEDSHGQPRTPSPERSGEPAIELLLQELIAEIRAERSESHAERGFTNVAMRALLAEVRALARE